MLDSSTVNDGLPAPGVGRPVVRFLLIIGFAIGLWRLWHGGFSEPLQVSPDLRPIYLSARALAAGDDPYSRDAISKQWQIVREPNEPDLGEDFFYNEPAVYPPTTFALLWPLTFPTWKAVRIGWLIGGLLTSVLAWMALVRVAGLPLFHWRSALLGVIWLELGPFQTVIHLANATLLTVNLLVFTVYFATRRSEVIAAVILAVAVCLKPQLAAELLVYYAVTRRWVLVTLASALVGTLCAVALIRLQLHPTWLSEYMHNLHAVSVTGGLSDPSRANPLHWRFINFQFPLYALFSTPQVVETAARLITVALCLLFAWSLWRARAWPEPLTVSIPLILALFPLYHSYYDALILVFPIAWVVSTLGRTRTLEAVVALACTAPFYICVAWALNDMVVSGRIPPRIADTTWFNLFVFPCETWALLILSLVLMHVLARQRAASQPASMADVRQSVAAPTPIA
jgi:hypothetical protein